MVQLLRKNNVRVAVQNGALTRRSQCAPKSRSRLADAHPVPALLPGSVQARRIAEATASMPGYGSRNGMQPTVRAPCNCDSAWADRRAGPAGRCPDSCLGETGKGRVRCVSAAQAGMPDGWRPFERLLVVTSLCSRGWRLLAGPMAAGAAITASESRSAGGRSPLPARECRRAET